MLVPAELAPSSESISSLALPPSSPQPTPTHNPTAKANDERMECEQRVSIGAVYVARLPGLVTRKASARALEGGHHFRVLHSLPNPKKHARSGSTLGLKVHSDCVRRECQLRDRCA